MVAQAITNENLDKLLVLFGRAFKSNAKAVFESITHKSLGLTYVTDVFKSLPLTTPRSISGNSISQQSLTEEEDKSCKVKINSEASED